MQMNTAKKMTIWGVVIVIIAAIAVVAAIAVPRVLDMPDRMKHKIVRSDMAGLNTALKIYRFEQGAFPTPEQGLDILVHIPTNGPRSSPYLERTPVDPWQQHFRYSMVNGRPEIRSSGPDMKFDTTDDISDRY